MPAFLWDFFEYFFFPDNSGIIVPPIIKNCSVEKLNPRRCGSPDAITPEQVLRHHRSAQGWHGGTGSCPLLSSYQHPEFHIHGKGILQSLENVFF